MTRAIEEGDKIFQMFKQYRTLLEHDSKIKNHVRVTHLVASQLTLAHMVDHLVCILRDDEKPTVRKLDGPPKR